MEPGTYNVKLTVSDGIRSKSILRTGYVKVGQCAGIDPAGNIQSIRVYPNPAGEMVTISVPGAQGTVKVGIFDGFGREVKSVVTAGSLGNCRVTLNISGLKRGLYLVRVTDARRSQVHKLIVN